MTEKPTDWKALRTCKVCGIQAFTVEDLEQFTRDKSCLYGRRTCCNSCRNEQRRGKWLHEYYLKHDRTREQALIEKFEHPIKCYFCGKIVTKLEGRDADSLIIHSLNENHEDFDPNNKVPSHGACHKRYHNTGKRNPNWKGDEASDHTKYTRAWYRKRKAEGFVRPRRRKKGVVDS